MPKCVSLLRDSDEEAISLLSREFPDRSWYSESRHIVAKTWLVHVADRAAADIIENAATNRNRGGAWERGQDP